MVEAEAEEVKLAVLPAQTGLLTCGFNAGGMGLITTEAFAVVVPQALVTESEIGKIPAAGYETAPGASVDALVGEPPVKVQEYVSEGSRQSLTTAVGLTLKPAQTLGTALIETCGGACATMAWFAIKEPQELVSVKRIV